MAFTDSYAKFMSLYKEQGEAQPMDATQPAPQQVAPPTQPQSQQEEPDALPPEGYVDMVRMLAKALVMNVPAGTIDTLFTKPINQESAIQIREVLQQAIASNENFEDNPQRITNPHVKQFVGSINENNFMAKYKEILNIMKRFSNDPNLKPK
jgi:hypothetical protein